MNKIKFEKFMEKYRSNYYHDNTYYDKKMLECELNKRSCLVVDHLEIIYDLIECEITEQDVDFKFDNNISTFTNLSELEDYIRKLEMIDNNLEKALIHLGWYFVLSDKYWKEKFQKEKSLDKIGKKQGETLYKLKLTNYKAEKMFMEFSNKVFNFL